MFKILIVEDDFRDQNIMRMILPQEYSVTVCSSGARAVDLLKSSRFQAILLDIVLPGLDGFSVLQEVRRLSCPPPVIIVSGQSDSGTVARAFRCGAYDYIEKPFTVADLLAVLSQAIEKQIRELRAVTPHKRDPADSPAFSGFIGESEAIRAVKRHIAAFAPSELPVLITGESGTGKELAARAVHTLSQFSRGPFLPVNCGAVPESLFEAEFFGSERGAYTGAVTRPGTFEQADGGTIFLDEIGEMNVSMQVKLLRVLEQNELHRVGGAAPRPFHTRVVSATNTNIQHGVESGRFRIDLFYRIGVLHITIPPLRNRRTDIPLLAAHLLSAACVRTVPERPCPVLTRPAQWKLSEHDWPGNIRELKNVLERALLLSIDREIGPELITFH